MFGTRRLRRAVAISATSIGLTVGVSSCVYPIDFEANGCSVHGSMRTENSVVRVKGWYDMCDDAWWVRMVCAYVHTDGTYRTCSSSRQSASGSSNTIEFLCSPGVRTTFQVRFMWRAPGTTDWAAWSENLPVTCE